MPKFSVEASAQLENVASITFPNNYPYFCNLTCGFCGEKSEKPVVLVKSNEVEGIRAGVVNLRRKCKFCGRESDIRIIKDEMTYNESSSPEWSSVLELECRGTEISEVLLSDDTPLNVVGTEGFSFEDVILEDNEFYGYDEKRKIEASITEFKTRIVKTK